MHAPAPVPSAQAAAARSQHQQQQQHAYQYQQSIRLYDAPRQRAATNIHADLSATMPLPTVRAELPRDEDQVSFSSAQVVDSRINYSEDGSRRFVEYRLEVDTHTRGLLYAWHRYSVFLQLASTLQLRDGYRRSSSAMPKLPSKKIFGNFAETTISARFEKLNEFLAAATGPEFAEWGIRLDDGTCVYKRSRGKAASGQRDSTASNTSTATTGSSPRRRRLSRRLSLMGSFSFRRPSTAEK